MKITIGHTPDADDAFMFYAIVNDKIEHGFDIEHVIEDIESLNKRAFNHELDVTAISAHAYPYTQDYVILRSGASFGLGYGPIVIAKKHIEDLSKARIAIPGRFTTAALLLRLAIGDYNFVELRFDEIINAIINDEVDAGLVIHELQITYYRYKLKKILDLADYWDDLPLPLGINVASKRRLDEQRIRMIDDMLRRSIIYALNNMDEAIGYALRFARGNDKDITSRFVRMYVNDLTIDMSNKGEQALKRLYSLAYKKGFIKSMSIEFSQ